MEINVKMGLKEIVSEELEWNNLAQNRDKWLAVINMVTKLRASWKAGIFLTLEGIIGFPRSTSFLWSQLFIRKFMVSCTVSYYKNKGL